MRRPGVPDAPGRFATLATVDPDGSPLQAVVWYRLQATVR